MTGTGWVAIATDCNPGSSFTTSMSFCIVVAVRDMKLTPAEALWSATAGGAAALRRDNVGVFGVPFTLETIRQGYTNKEARPSRSAVMEYLRAASNPRRFGTTLHYLSSYAKELPRGAGWPGVDIPVLVTWGMEDPFLYPSNGERLVRSLSNAELKPMAGVGHYSHEDAGEQLFSVLNDWFARNFEFAN